MLAHLIVPFVLFAAIALAAFAAGRLNTPAAIVFLVFGIVLAFVPGLPSVRLDPNVVLLGLLPPVLYSSGVGMSWRGFKTNLRPILLLAIGCVLFTAAAVAALVHYAFGMPWAVGFVLGAIVSPPDSVAPMAIARRLSVPQRVLDVLEGESLCNDATALLLFGFALTAASTGAWSVASALGTFVAIVFGEIAWGVVLAWLVLRLRHRAQDAQVEIVIALLTPFAAFWPPHLMGGSGVLAAVSAGLFVSWNGARFISPPTRLQGFFIWDFVVFSITGAIFLLTGLQAHALVQSGVGTADWPRLLAAGLWVTVTVIVVRFIWVYPAAYLPRLLSARIRQKDPMPPLSYLLVIGFTGIRGVVSLAAALSLPTMLGSQPFAGRDLVLVATYCVIVVTLVGLGLTLPWVIQRVGLGALGRAEAIEDQRAEVRARIEGVDAVLRRIDAMEREGARADLVRSLRSRHADRRAHLAATADDAVAGSPTADEAMLQFELVKAERAWNAKSYAEGLITDRRVAVSSANSTSKKRGLDTPPRAPPTSARMGRSWMGPSCSPPRLARRMTDFVEQC